MAESVLIVPPPKAKEWGSAQCDTALESLAANLKPLARMNDRKASVLIVDDHPLFRERLCQLIENEPDLQVSGEAETAQDAVQLVRATRPPPMLLNSVSGSGSTHTMGRNFPTTSQRRSVIWPSEQCSIVLISSSKALPSLSTTSDS
jgi:hypothetical protein